MPDSGLLMLSALCVVGGISIILYPNALLKLNEVLNRTLMALDQRLMRFRHVIGVVLLLVSYLFFRLALLVPGMRG